MSRKHKTKREAPTISMDGAADYETDDPVTPAEEQASPRNPAHFWPDGKPLPVSIVKPSPVPCPACRRVRLDTGAQACIIRIYEGGVCYLRCRACQHRFKMPIARGS